MRKIKIDLKYLLKLKLRGFYFKSLAFLFIIFACLNYSFGQGLTDIHGRVVSESGVPLSGVSINVKGSTIGTTTDSEGNFSIQANTGAILTFSSVGYVSEEFTVTSEKAPINVHMRQETSSLEEVVVVGYGTQKRSDLTASVSSINFESQEVSSRAVTNLSSAMAGMASGLSVSQPSGSPGADQATISVRGVGSLNASTNPLIIIDGTVGDLSMLNPDDVASISILKDAASAAIYGSRASNGAIIITTKSGENTNGKLTFNYSGRTSFGKPSQVDDLISYTPDHMSLLNLASENDGLGAIWTQDEINNWAEKSKTDQLDYPNTNWWTAIMKPNLIMDHHISVRGGSDKIKFYSSLGYFSNDGIVPNTGFKRVNFRNNLTYKVNKWLQLGNILTLYKSKRDPADQDELLVWWRASTPGSVPKHDGRFGGGQTPRGVESIANNPLWYAEGARGIYNVNDFTEKIFGTITPFKGLSITGDYYTEMNFQDSWSGHDPLEWWNFQDNSLNRSEGHVLPISTSNAKSNMQIYDLFGTYEKSIGVHSFTVLVGYNQQSFNSSFVDATKMNLLSYSIPVLDAASSDPTASGSGTANALRSYFGRINYSFSGKYLFEANARYDGSSRFAPNDRWGLFPSFAGAWVISKESFWSRIRNIDFFKLRASWGRLGNNGIGDYEWQSLYQAANTSFNGNIASGLRYNFIANPQLSWENTDVTNFGIDLDMFKGFTVTLNYYNKLTDNILSQNPIPNINGGITPPRTNSAKVSNKGFEADLGYNGQIGAFSFSVNGNVSYNKNKILKYKGGVVEPHGLGQAWTEGYPIGIFWIRKVDHIVQTQDEANKLISDGYTFSSTPPGPGDFLYQDANGDKRIDDNDRVLMGNPIPLYNYGANITLSYKGFDFYVLVSGVAKWDKYLFSSLYQSQRLINYLAVKSLLNTWTPDNTNTNVPKVYLNDPKNDAASDHYLHDASYLKINSLQLGYTIPKNVTNSIGIDKIRVYVNFENYFLFTSYPGQDPQNEIPGYGVSYPIIKSISTGLNVSF